MRVFEYCKSAENDGSKLEILDIPVRSEDEALDPIHMIATSAQKLMKTSYTKNL